LSFQVNGADGCQLGQKGNAKGCLQFGGRAKASWPPTW
jgi:hypothetical protein